jgi:hypothetical protein
MGDALVVQTYLTETETQFFKVRFKRIFFKFVHHFNLPPHSLSHKVQGMCEILIIDCFILALDQVEIRLEDFFNLTFFFEPRKSGQIKNFKEL